MKKIINQIFLFLFFVIINSSCADDPYSCKDKKVYPEVYTFYFNAGSQVLSTKRLMEVLHQIVTNRFYPISEIKYKYFEVYNGSLVLNYNQDKEVLFVRSGSGFQWQNVYPNVKIKNIENFNISDAYELEPNITDNYIKLIDSTFIKETNSAKINEAKAFLVTNLCK